MSIYEQFVPALIVNGKAITEPLNTPLQVTQELTGNIGNLIEQNVFPNQIKPVLEFDKNFKAPYFFMRKTDNGRISLYLSTLMKQTTFNSSYSALQTVPVWTVTSAHSATYTRKFSVGQNQQQRERIAHDNSNPFFLLYGLHNTQPNGALITGNLSEMLLPTKPSVFNTEVYQSNNNATGTRTVAEVINTTCLKIWKQLNELSGTFNEDEVEIDTEQLQAVWDEYEKALKVFQSKGYLNNTTAIYAENNQVHLGNFVFLSDNTACNQLNPKVFLGKSNTNVTDLPVNRVSLTLKKQDHQNVDSTYNYGLFQLEGISTQRVELSEEDAKTIPESFTGRATVRDNLNNDLFIDVRIIEQSYGRKGQDIKKLARNFSKITTGSEVFVTGELKFVPNGTDGHGIKVQLLVDNYKFIKGSVNTEASLPTSENLEGFNLDFLSEESNLVENNQSDSDNESKTKQTNLTDDEMNS